MLNLENLSFSYNSNTEVLKNFNLQLSKGDVVAIKGPSGCGKSTILRLIAGLEKVQLGTITLNGEVINNLPTHKRNVGFVFQSLALFPHLTIRKNIEFGLTGYSKEQRKSLVEEIALKVEINDMLDRYPHEISGGQKQRAAIARSLVVKPSILLLDEPFTALDEELKESVRKDIRRILESFDITTILVTHDINDAIGLNARLVNLSKDN